MRDDELDFEIDRIVEMINVDGNAGNIPVARVDVIKQDLICETLRIRHV